MQMFQPQVLTTYTEATTVGYGALIADIAAGRWWGRVVWRPWSDPIVPGDEFPTTTLGRVTAVGTFYAKTSDIASARVDCGCH